MTNQTTDYKGYISIHRKIEDSWLWLSEPFSKAQAWIDLLLIANHKNSSFFLRGIKIEVKRGHIAWSEEKLSSRWKWSRGKLRTFLKLLETEQQIIQHKSNKINIVEIINYDLYQKQDNKIDSKKTTERQQSEQQKDIYNNVNNDNNDNNENNILELVKGLQFILEAKLNKKISTTSWKEPIRLLVEKDLAQRENAIEDVKRAIQEVGNRFGEQYFPVIQSGGSLREKFSKIENAMRNNTQTNKPKLQESLTNLWEKYDNE